MAQTAASTEPPGSLTSLPPRVGKAARHWGEDPRAAPPFQYTQHHCACNPSLSLKLPVDLPRALLQKRALRLSTLLTTEAPPLLLLPSSVPTGRLEKGPHQRDGERQTAYGPSLAPWPSGPLPGSQRVPPLLQLHLGDPQAGCKGADMLLCLFLCIPTGLYWSTGPQDSGFAC